MFSKGHGANGLKARLGSIALAVTLTGAAIFVPFAAVADTTSDTIAALQAQIAALQAQLLTLAGNPPAPVAGKCTFTRSLTLGMKGDDVMCLQKYLMGTGHYTYSGGATGYFGNISKSAAAAWQAANGVSPAVGYFGTISRAKYDMLMASAPMPTPTPTSPFGTPTPTPTGPTPTPTGPTPTPTTVGALSVSTPMQPGDTLAPPLAARVPATKITLTASTMADVKVEGLTVERQGLADDSAIDGVVLLDEDGTQIGLSKTLNALHQATLNEPFWVKAGTSKTVTIGLNRPAAGSNNGQIAHFAVISVNAGASTVTGTLPVIGSNVTINETLTIGSLTSPSRGVTEPGSARTSLEVGTKQFVAAGVRWTVGSAEMVSLEQVRFYQAGSAGSGDIENVNVNVKGVAYKTTASADGKYFVAKFSPAIEYDKGAVIDFDISADVAGGSNRTIDFDIQRRTDVVVKGNNFKYYIIPNNGSTANTSTQGEGFTSTEPYYDAYAHTISTGSLRVEKSNTVPSGNVGVDLNGVKLGAFGLEAKGEGIQISSFKLSFSLSSGEAGTQIDNVGLYDEKGTVVAGPKDVGSDTTVTFSDSWTIPTGYHVYTVKGKLTTDFEDGDTVIASVDPDGDITAKGQNTGLTITASPTSSTSANTMTVRRASLKVSVSDSPSAQNVVRGINGYLFAKIQYDATASGEDVRITAQDLTITPAASGDSDDLNNCQMFDGTTALNTGGNVVNPTGAASTAVKGTFTLDNNLYVAGGSVKLIDVKCNISSNFVANGTVAIGLTSTGNDTTVVGKGTGTTVVENTTNSTGPVMTVRSGGALTISRDPSTPSERYGIAGKTDVVASAFKLHSDYEDLKLTKFGFNLASSTASTSDVLKVGFWDGVTKVGEAVFSSDNYIGTSTLSGSFMVPKDGDKIITASVDLIAKESLGKPGQAGGDSGHLVQINWDGFRTLATEAVGQSSGSTLNAGPSGPHITGYGIRVMKTYPTFERLALPTNTLANGTMDLYRFKVTAPAEGDVGLFKMTFRVSSTTAATTSLFSLYGYSDSAFSVNAYPANPLNANDVDCVGSMSTEGGANDTCSADNAATVTYDEASQKTDSNVQIFFDPAVSSASKPGIESINVPAGSTRYFKFVGNVARAATADTISVALLGDAAFQPSLTYFSVTQASGIPEATLATSTIANLSSLVWSPNTTSTSATTTNDWLNGYLLPGLPTTEMSQQTLSK